MEKRTKQTLFVTAFGVLLFVGLNNIGAIVAFLSKSAALVAPVVIGCILAMFLNVPMTGYCNLLKKMFKNAKKQPPERFFQITAFVLTIISVIGVLTAVCLFVLPELFRSIVSLYELLEQKVPTWINYLKENNIDAAWLEKTLSSFDFSSITGKLTNGIGSIVNGVITVISSTVSTTMTAVFALIISIYILLEKQWLSRSGKNLCYAYLKKRQADSITRFCRLFHEYFSKFLSGQTVEALILGTLIFIFFLIFKIPYALVVGALTAVCALVPYIGAFFSCFVAVVLTLIVDPSKVITCLIVYLVVQFVENQFIYPHVVGSSVGLSPLLTLLGALIGANLFGIIGILFFIPLTAVINILVTENIRKRLSKAKVESKVENEETLQESET